MFYKTEGAIENIAGRVQEAFGRVMGDPMTQVRGRARRIVGGAQYGYGDVLNRFRSSAVRNPVATVALVGGICFLLGALLAKSAEDRAETEDETK